MGGPLTTLLALSYQPISMSGIYMRLLSRYPLAVQSVQTGLLCGTGDVISQTLIEKRAALDPWRSAKFAAIGSLWIAPLIRFWYLRLEKMFGVSVALVPTLKKVATDQIVMAPFMSLGIINLVGISQGKRTIEELREKLSLEYVEVLLNGWKLWPAAQIINFYFVPFLLRPLYVNFVALFWNTYLAWRTNNEESINDSQDVKSS